MAKKPQNKDKKPAPEKVTEPVPEEAAPPEVPEVREDVIDEEPGPPAEEQPPVEEKQPLVEESKAEEPVQEPRLVFKNVVRSRQTRLHRMVMPGRARFKQYVAGHRILRGQTISLPRTQILAAADSILTQVECGLIMAYPPDGPGRHTPLTTDAFFALVEEWEGAPVERELPATAMPDCSPGPQASKKRVDEAAKKGAKKAAKKAPKQKEEE